MTLAITITAVAASTTAAQTQAGGEGAVPGVNRSTPKPYCRVPVFAGPHIRRLAHLSWRKMRTHTRPTAQVAS